MTHPQGVPDFRGAVDQARAEGAPVDFLQKHDIRLKCAQHLGLPREVALAIHAHAAEVDVVGDHPDHGRLRRGQDGGEEEKGKSQSMHTKNLK